MGWWKAMLGAGCVVPLTGCNLFKLAAHNLYNEPVQYADECNLDIRLEEEARLAWREVCRQYPERSFTLEFADGFQDGYADHLQHGGPPRPPALPPLKYRRSKYFTPEGSLRVKDYLCGAKYGAEVAAATGYRAFLTVPVLLAEPRSEQPLPITVLPTPPDLTTEPAAGEKPNQTPAIPIPIPKPPSEEKPPATPPSQQSLPSAMPKAEPPRPDPIPLGTPKPADALPPKFDGRPPAVTPPVTPSAGPSTTAPRPTPLRPGETGTGLPAIDLPFPDFIAPPPAITPPTVKPQSGTDAMPGGVIPASAAAPPVSIPSVPAAINGRPPAPRPPAAAPPPVRPPAAEPPK